MERILGNFDLLPLMWTLWKNSCYYLGKCWGFQKEPNHSVYTRCLYTLPNENFEKWDSCLKNKLLIRLNFKQISNKRPISLTRDTVWNCVKFRKHRYYNFDFLLGQSQCKCPHKKLKLWYLYYLSNTQWHKIRTK